MNKETLIKVTNRFSGNVGYFIPDLQVKRTFMPRETKEITFEELEKLSFVPGGMKIITDYLVVKDKDAIKEILPNVEPEYFYGEAEVKNILEQGSLDQFLDCLDFAPDGVLDIIKDLAVNLPLDNMSKRNAIKEKLGFDVTKAIEIQNTKFDGDENENAAAADTKSRGRRASVPGITDEAATSNSARRSEMPSWKDIIKE